MEALKTKTETTNCRVQTQLRICNFKSNLNYETYAKDTIFLLTNFF